MNFEKIISFSAKTDKEQFQEKIRPLQAGDVIAYRKTKGKVATSVAKGHLNDLGYLLNYGHLGVIVNSPITPNELIIFSSHSFKGPNIDESLATLKTHDWDIYRLDKPQYLNNQRLSKFVTLVHRPINSNHSRDDFLSEQGSF